MTRARRSPLALVAIVLALAGCAAPATPASTASSGSPPPMKPASTARPVDQGPERVVDAPPLARPSQPAIDVRYDGTLLADHCVDRDVGAPPTSEAALTVLDRTYALPADYAPSDLVPASVAGLAGSSGDKLVRSVIVEDLAAMAAAWRDAGLTIIVESAYRSYGNQAATFESWASRLGYAEAVLRSARAGHSEHQLGTAIDFTSPGWAGRFGDWALESEEGAWMAANAWRHGFVMSYPSGAQEETCFGYEPWHYRWIGREAAAAHRSSGMYLREFLERYIGG